METGLKDEILAGESPTLEFKRDIPEQPVKYLKTVSAFAIQVALYDDRLEIISPGGLPRGMTIRRMMSGCSRCRNKAVAEAFAYMHVAEKWGLGIPNAMDEFVKHGLSKPEYTDWGNAVKVTVRRRRRKSYAGDGKVEDNGTSQSGAVSLKGPVNGPVCGTINDTVNVPLNSFSEGIVSQTPSNNETLQVNNVPLSVPLKMGKAPLRDAIASMIRECPGINRKNLAIRLNVTVKTIDRQLSSMVDIERRGSKKTGGYYYCKQGAVAP